MTARRRSLILARAIVWPATLACWVSAFVVTHRPVTGLPLVVPVSDKTLHLLGYIGLSATLSASLWLARVRAGRALFVTIIVGLVYGVIDELLQLPVGRTADVADWFADAAGTVLGAGIMWAIASLARARRRRVQRERSHAGAAEVTIRP